MEDKRVIPVKKIEEKIEELIKEGDYRSENNPKGRIHFQPEITDHQISILQQLIKENCEEE